MIQRGIFFFSIALFSWGLSAQTLISGRVTDDKGFSLSSVILRVYSVDNDDLLSYCFTDEKGDYSLTIRDNVQELKLNFSFLGYEKVEKVVPNLSAGYDIRMVEKGIELKEVTVKAPPISGIGDTIIYNVASFRNKSDRNIEDVIKKLPGVEVDASGAISYKGESINKFYIEGMNLLGGRYGLATKNISPDDVSSINIYENHQPQKVLKGIEFSDKAALNLKLKNNRMLKPIGYALASGGHGEKNLWQAEAFSLLINTRMQQLVTCKTNNWGDSYTAENTLFIDNGLDRSTIAETLFPKDVFDVPDIPIERYYRNKSVSATTNILLKLKQDLTLTLNADYTFDHNRYQQSRNSNYFLENEQLIINENNSSSMRGQQAKFFFNIEKNSDRSYVQNELNFKGTFNRNLYKISDNDLIRQKLNSNNYMISNLLNVITRKGSKLFQFKSIMSLANTPLNYIHVTSSGKADSLVRHQSIKGLSFYTNESTSFQWSFNSHFHSGLDISFESAYDELHTAAIPLKTLDNANSGYKLSTAFSPFLNYVANKIRWKLTIPFQLYNIHYTNFTDDDSYRLNKFYMAVRSTLHYKIKYNSSLSFVVGNNRTTGSLLNFVIYPLYTTYRDQVNYGSDDLSVRKNLYATTTFDYRNTMLGHFLTLRAGYQIVRNNTLRGNSVSEKETINHSVSKDNRMDIWSGYVYVAKNFRDLNMVIKLTSNTNFIRREMLRQERNYAVKNINHFVNADCVKGFLNDRIVVNFDFSYSLSGRLIKLQKEPKFSKKDAWNCVLDVSLFPLKALEIYATGAKSWTEQEYGGYKKNDYINMGLRWLKTFYEIELSARNITDERTFSLHRLDLYDMFYYQYSLRPCEWMLSFKYKF